MFLTCETHMSYQCEEKVKSMHLLGPRDQQVTKEGTFMKHAGELKSHAS